VTLLEKLDALSRRYARETLEPDGFARHYKELGFELHADLHFSHELRRRLR
jgi:hypothetical protein